MTGLEPLLLSLGTAAASAGTAVAGGGGALSALSAVATGVGGIVSTIGSVNAAKANARMAEQQGRVAQDQASAAASQSYTQNRMRGAAAEAVSLQGNLGSVGTVGSALDQFAAQGELDYLTQVYKGQLAKTGYQANAAQYRSQAQNALFSGITNTVANLAGNSMKMKKPGDNNYFGLGG